MKKAVIFGLSQLSQLLAYFLEEDGLFDVAAYTVEAQCLPPLTATHNGKPLIPFEQLAQSYPPEEYGVFICVGYTQMNQVRQRIFRMVKEKGYRILSYIHPAATVSTNCLGEGTLIMERAIVGAFTQLGVGNIIYAGAHIAHHTTVGNFNFFAVNAAVAGGVQIGNNCFFGNNCAVRDAVLVRDGTLVGAGCYLSHDTQPFSVEVPARSLTLPGKSSLGFDLTAPPKR